MHEAKIFDQYAKKFPAVYWDHSGEQRTTKVDQECAMAAAMADRIVQITLRTSAHLFLRSVFVMS